jgi:secondary-alkyl amine dehydrogenase [NAD(P)+]
MTVKEYGMRRIRAVVYGLGAMGCLSTRLLIEKGVEIVGALARSPAKIGRDVGKVAGLGHSIGVPVEGDAEAVLSRRPDIVLLCTKSFLPQVADQLRACVRHGANVVTIAEECLYPFSSSPVLAAEIDALAKHHGVTITGSGHQDIFWVNMVTLLLGASHRITSISGKASWNADDYGADIIKSKHVGETLEEFRISIERSDRAPTYGRNVLGAIARNAGFTPKVWTSAVQPVVAAADLVSKSVGATLRKGVVVGYSDVDHLQTFEGPVLSFEMAGHIYAPGQVDINEWHVTGDPELFLSNGNVPTQMTTCTQFVNRIPDVINAAPGFITIDALPQARFRSLPLHAYVGWA